MDVILVHQRLRVTAFPTRIPKARKASRRRTPRKKAHDPYASNYGQVQYTKVTAESWTEEGQLDEGDVGRSVVLYVTVSAIRPISNTIAAVVLCRHLSTERCVIVAGAFEGITRRMVRFATTLPKQ
ncbi:hypothetical protein BS78_03G360300, partial [Paspalum vaginatum]